MASYIRDESTLINSDAQSRSGRALSFDGANDYVQLPDLGITRTTQYTFSVWVYVTLLSAVRPLFGHGNSSSDRNGCHIAADGSVAGGSYNGTAYDGCATASGAIEVNKWHHVVFVRNGGSGDKIYVNGADRTVSGAASNLSISQKVLGTSDNTGLWFHGRMHDARVYSRNLTASEIAALYNATKQSGGDVAGTLYAADLAGMWPLEDMDGRTAVPNEVMLDLSGNGYHGKRSGPTAYVGADVPSSITNELGYSFAQTSLNAAYPDLWVNKFGAWAADGTGGAAVALTNQTWRGRTGLYAAKFLSGAAAGYGVNRVTTSGDAFTANGNRLFLVTMDVAFSRVPDITVQLYFTGGSAGPGVYIPVADATKYETADPTQWQRVVGYSIVLASSQSQYFAIYNANGTAGSDLTVYVDNVRYLDLGAYTDAGLLDGPAWPQSLPSLASDLTKDITGQAIQNRGPLAKRAQPKSAPCATFDGGNDYALSTVVANANAGTLCAMIYVPTGANGVALGARGPGNDRIYLGANATQLGAGVGELGYTTFHTGIPITTGEYHLAVTYDSGNAWLYLDGELVASSTYSTPPTTTYPIVLGMLNNAGTPNTAVACRLSDARLFNRALSAIEVASISVGNDIASGLLAHWPMNEKSGLTLFDSSGNGYHATATGMTSGELWAQTQDTYHAALMRGIRTGQGKRGYRSFDGGTQYFSRADDSKLNISGDVNAWWAVEVEISSTGAVRYFFDQYDSGLNQRGWALLVENVNNRAQIIISPDGTTTGIVILENTTALTANTRAFVFAYHDPVANQVGISINGGAFATASYSGGIHNSTSTVNVGVSKSSGAVANYHSGKVHVAATGLPSSQPSSWSAIRDAIYNSGSPLTYDQLTPTQLSDWGVKAWYDCDEWGPSLRDKHAGLDLTGTGYNADYPVPAPAGLIAAPTREYGTFRSDLAKSFIDTTSTSDTSCSAGEQLWACIFMRLPDIINNKGYLGKYSSSTEWLLYVSASQIAFSVIHTDATNSTRYIVTTPTGQWVLVFAYIDALTNAGQLSVGLGLNGESLSATSFVTKTPKNNTGDKVQIGNFFSGNNQPNADIAFAAIGKNPSSSFAAIRDLIYNSGTPLQYSDLSDAQKTAIGLVEWFEVGDYQGEEELIGKHASTVMTGSCIPSRTTQGGAGKLPPINTSIDFTGTTLSGGTAAPWTASQYLGYLTCSGSANGRDVGSAIVGNISFGAMSVYVRVRNLATALNRTFLDADNGAGASRALFLFKGADKKLSLYDGAYRDMGAAVDSILTDGSWHDLLFVWASTNVKLYVDGVLWGEVSGIASCATYAAAWTRTKALSDYTNGDKFSGDIARLIVADGIRVPGTILTAANLLDLRFDSINCEDEQGRIPSSAWLSGHTPAKLTVPTAYKSGVILPEGMSKVATPTYERRFNLFKRDQ